MKRNFALFCTALLLVCALTACGGDKQNQDTGGATTNNGETSQDGNNVGNAVGDVVEGAENGIQDAVEGTGDAIQDVVDGNDRDTAQKDTGNEVTDSVTKQRGQLGGVTYGQMLRNARVHDTDGDLRDHENAVTPSRAL